MLVSVTLTLFGALRHRSRLPPSTLAFVLRLIAALAYVRNFVFVVLLVFFSVFVLPRLCVFSVFTPSFDFIVLLAFALAFAVLPHLRRPPPLLLYLSQTLVFHSWCVLVVICAHSADLHLLL